MANEIKATATAGRTLYAVILTPAGLLYNGTSSVTLTAGAWAAGATMTNPAGQVYYGSFPTGLAAGIYTVLVFLQAGGSPAITDSLISQATFDWDGTKELSFSNLPAGGGSAPTVSQIAAAILTTPANLLTTDNTGKVGTNNLPSDYALRATAPSWWVAPDNADIVTSLSDLVSLLARTDNSTNVAAIKAQTDKLATMLQGSSPSTFTPAALANAPSGTGASAATIAAAVMSDVTDVIGVDILAIKAKTDALSVIPTAIQIRQEMDTNSTQLTKLGTPISASIAADIANQPGLLLGLAASSYNAAGTFGQKFNAAGSVSAATIAAAVMSDVTDVIGVDILAIKVKTDALSVTPVVDILTALHADSQWQTILADVNGVFDYNESTHVLVLKDKTGTTTLATLTLTPGTAAITHRASA